MSPKEGGLWSSSVIMDSTAGPLNRKLSILAGELIQLPLICGKQDIYSNRSHSLICRRACSKTLLLKDSSVNSIWTYLPASPCHTTNTTIPQTNISMIKPLINAVSQFLQMCRNISEREFLRGMEAVAVGHAFRIYIMVWQWNLRNMLHLSLHPP